MNYLKFISDHFISHGLKIEFPNIFKIIQFINTPVFLIRNQDISSPRKCKDTKSLELCRGVVALAFKGEGGEENETFPIKSFVY